jgi:Undecaprenyl-phosphate galactose phosphotransferase WbaP
MARYRDALAGKLLTKDGAVPTSIFNRAERRLSCLFRSHENDPANDTRAHPSHRFLEYPLRAFIVTDILALALSFLAAWLFALTGNIVFFRHQGLVASSFYDALAMAQYAVIGAGLLLWFGHTGHYQLRMPFWMEAKKIVEAIGLAMLIDCFLQFVSKQSFSRIWLLSCWGFAIVGIIALRALWRAHFCRQGTWQIPTLLVGDGPTSEEARAALHSEPGLGYMITAHIRDVPHALQAAGNSWKTLCRQYDTHYVVIALDGKDFFDARPSLAQLMREHVPFSVAPPMQNLSVFDMIPQCFMGHDVMLLTRNNGLDRPLPRFLKRSFDIGVAVFILMLLSPLLAFLALLVRLDGGPAFYRHDRIGHNGQTFSCLKYRSMVVKSDEVLAAYLAKYPLAQSEWNRDQKLRHDPRITRLGAFLRRTSLDEMPQLINVLRGEMSIVGPRPIIAKEASKYHRDIAFYHRVRPGITGLWQVSGRNDVSYEDRVRMDSWYVRNWSLWHDIAIICKTFSVMITQRGAY